MEQAAFLGGEQEQQAIDKAEKLLVQSFGGQRPVLQGRSQGVVVRVRDEAGAQVRAAPR